MTVIVGGNLSPRNSYKFRSYRLALCEAIARANCQALVWYQNDIFHPQLLHCKNFRKYTESILKIIRNCYKIGFVDMVFHKLTRKLTQFPYTEKKFCISTDLSRNYPYFYGTRSVGIAIRKMTELSVADSLIL